MACKLTGYAIKPMISIIHPSRSRPEKAFATAKKWIENAGCDVEYILSLDLDEPTNNPITGASEYVTFFNGHLPTYKLQIDKNRSAIDAINNAAKVATGNIFIQIADDFDCPPLWGKQILDATKGKTDWILKTKDGIQEWIITLPIMDRAYYNRFGYIYHPYYLHMFCDTELSCVADLTGRKIEANIEFTHNHYSTGKSEKDSVSIKADSTWAQGEKLFIERYKKNFDLQPSDIVGKITNQNYLSWIKGKL